MWGQHVHGVTSSLLELARELGFTEEQVHQIRIENPNSLQDQSHALLRHWLERDCRPAAGRAAGARRAGPRAERGVPTGPQVPGVQQHRALENRPRSCESHAGHTSHPAFLCARQPGRARRSARGSRTPTAGACARRPVFFLPPLLPRNVKGEATSGTHPVSCFLHIVEEGGVV